MADKNYFIQTGYPVREKNFVLPLINGEEAWKTIYTYLSNAGKSIHLCFWALESDLELIRNSNEMLLDPDHRRKYTLYDILYSKVQAGVKVRILLWDYPANARNPLADALIRLSGDIGIFEVLYQPHPSLIGSWHQKSIVIDDETAFLGGMNAKGNDWDTSDHLVFDLRRAGFRHTARERTKFSIYKDDKAINPPRHDYMVLVIGQAVTDVQANFVERWNYCISEKMDYYKRTSKLPVPSNPKPYSDVRAQISRTIPIYGPSPQGEKSILESYKRAIVLAEKYIYIEDQYFRSESLSVELANACKKNKQLILIIVTMPAYLTDLEPNENYKLGDPRTYWTTESFERIRAVIPDFCLFYLQSSDVDYLGKRVFKTIDLHSKIMIVDDEWYTIGSCNINDRGFETEGELNISVNHNSAKDLRKSIFSKHLNEPCPDDIADAIILWGEHCGYNYRAWKSNSKPKSFIYPFVQTGPVYEIPFSSKWF